MSDISVHAGPLLEINVEHSYEYSATGTTIYFDVVKKGNIQDDITFSYKIYMRTKGGQGEQVVATVPEQRTRGHVTWFKYVGDFEPQSYSIKAFPTSIDKGFVSPSFRVIKRGGGTYTPVVDAVVDDPTVPASLLHRLATAPTTNSNSLLGPDKKWNDPLSMTVTTKSQVPSQDPEKHTFLELWQYSGQPGSANVTVKPVPGSIVDESTGHEGSLQLQDQMVNHHIPYGGHLYATKTLQNGGPHLDPGYYGIRIYRRRPSPYGEPDAVYANFHVQ